MSQWLGRRRLVAAIILVLVVVVATESVVLAATVRQGTVEYMKVATETSQATTSSTSWADVPATALAVPVPSGEHDFFQISFTAQPQCLRLTGTAAYGSCYVRALVDGQQVEPGPFYFGSALNVDSSPSTTVQWVGPVLAPGTHYAKIQFRVNTADNGVYFYARTMTVIRARAY